MILQHDNRFSDFDQATFFSILPIPRNYGSPMKRKALTSALKCRLTALSKKVLEKTILLGRMDA